MAKFDIREFNYITCGKAQNTYNVSYAYTDDGMIQSSVKKPAALSTLRTTTFFGDIGKTDSMAQKFATNKESFYDIGHKKIIHNSYALPRTQLKTTAEKHSSSIFGSNEHLDIYVHQISDDFQNVIQFDDYAFALTKMTQNEPVTLSVQMNNMSDYDASYHFVLSSGKHLTYSCPMPSEVANGSYKTYQDLINSNIEASAYVLSSIFNVKRNLDGIMHNYVIELPESSKHNDYTKGYIVCDQIVCKNHLNYAYTMPMDNNYSLSNCREYCNIGVCGNQLYMAYRDNVSYVNTTPNGTKTTLYAYYSPIDGLMHAYNVYEYALSMQQPKDSYTYQHIEVLDIWHRYDSSGKGHKSSMFSLQLNNTGLNSSTINANAKQKLRQNIMNNIRSIIDKITPANTQLFNIYFEGE